MKKLLLATLLILLIPSRAVADVVVLPEPFDPGVSIEVERDVPAPPPTEPVSDSDPPPPPPPDYSGNCVVDEVVGNFGCPLEPEPDPLGRPPLTEGDILHAVQQIGLPALDVRVQPGNTTLVNVPTIFSTRPEEFEHAVFLLGYNVDLVADPLEFTWRYGDGTLSTTTEPGRPYPAMDVTHAYLTPVDGVRPSVDVTYRVTFRVDNGPWRSLSTTITAPGPAAEIDVKEAVPVLAKR